MPVQEPPPVGVADSLGPVEGWADGEAGVAGDGDDAVGDASVDDAPGSGEEPVALTPAGGVAFADVDGLGRAAPGLPVPDARGDAPAEGVVPPLTAGPATEEPPSEERAEPVGAGEFRTRPAGWSPCCPGPGSQGASELPDSRATTMTTA